MNQSRLTGRTSPSTSSTISKDRFSFQSQTASTTSINACRPKDTTITTGMASHCNHTLWRQWHRYGHGRCSLQRRWHVYSSSSSSQEESEETRPQIQACTNPETAKDFAMAISATRTTKSEADVQSGQRIWHGPIFPEIVRDPGHHITDWNTWFLSDDHKEDARLYADHMKLNVNAVEQTNALGCTVTYNPHDVWLILIWMTLNNNKTVDTLIDCGLELDIINKQTCIKSQIPIDTSASTYMWDAGQHDTCLEGKCIRIRLSAGNLVTITDLWVGSKLPFALLLGRPWQRRNQVSIEECETGTWLCRRDPYDHKIWETCVIPARHAEDFFDSFQKNFFGHDPTAVDVYLAKKTLEPDPDNDKVAKTNNSWPLSRIAFHHYLIPKYVTL